MTSTVTPAPGSRSRAFKADAQARYAKMRAKAPIHRVRGRDGFEVWIVVGDDLAREALTHPLLVKEPPQVAADALRAVGQEIHFAGTGIGGNMLTADPPDHTRLRRLLAKDFTSRRMTEMAPQIRQIAHRLLDALPAEGEIDLVAAYTAPLPLAVICDLLGIPESHRTEFQIYSRQGINGRGEEQREGMRLLNGQLADLLADKRRHPESDLLSSLISNQEDDRLSDAELLGTAVLLVTAGQETTVNLLGNAMVALLEYPDQLALLRERPDLLPGAVEEFLRYDPPLELTPARFAAEDLTLGGEQIPLGGLVMVALGSANRDAGLADGGDPEILDITRQAGRHVAFGHGIHYCLGAPLARIEATIGLELLLEALPVIEPAVPGQTVTWLASGITRGPVALPIRYRKSAD
jgi:cytochrome P450